MTKSELATLHLPAKPGVYFFIGKQKQVLYIGKATSLTARVRSYFDSAIAEKRSLLIEQMVAEARTIEWTETDSVLEALLMEANLIRTHKPTYNTRAKDDKSYNSVVITREEFPRILIVRAKDLQGVQGQYAKVFGPFPEGKLFRAALKIIRKLFQYYDTPVPLEAHHTKLHKGKLDFNRQIGLYPSADNKKEYARTIRHITLFFEGKKDTIIKELQRDMLAYAGKEEFERAHEVKKKLFALQHIQDVALISDDARMYKDDRMFRIEAYDVAHMSGTNMVGVMTVVTHDTPQNSEYRKFIIRECSHADDPRALSEIVRRRMAHTEWTLPDLIVVDGSTAQVRAAEKVLAEGTMRIPVVGVVKDEHHKPKNIIGPGQYIAQHRAAILLANAEAHRFAIGFHRKKRRANALQ